MSFSIGLDATSLCRKITGIEYYTLHLIKAILDTDNSNHFAVFFRKAINPELEEYSQKAKFIICPSSNQIFCEQLWLPYISIKEKIDFMHFFAFPPGLLYRKKFIMTIFDAVLWDYESTLSWKGKYYMKPLNTLASKRAKLIITISGSSKKDILQCLKMSENMIANNGAAIDENFHVVNNTSLLQQVKEKYSLPDKFILSTCSFEPRKNIITLIKAYKKLISSSDLNHKLVLVGRKAWGADTLLQEINSLMLDNNIIITDYIPTEDLVCLYNLADMFVYPSIYEGFGLPVIEAMACGVPVIASDIPVIHEVAGNACVYFDSLNIEDLVNKIYSLISNKNIQEELKQKGIERAKLFSWKNVANSTLSCYKRV